MASQILLRDKNLKNPNQNLQKRHNESAPIVHFALHAHNIDFVVIYSTIPTEVQAWKLLVKIKTARVSTVFSGFEIHTQRTRISIHKAFYII